ncbi:hypothetical protein AMATHDRAFT_1325 [Amanita thiersii Skay4041]|uniref:Uncharacterized protein n=1 Tax=Amanita thiersii Skay4041 TaxID=703135 RepID=A0A2A9NZB6_9AGAR|nr:hypothetical protein AMATHDRAFT_1325 [Amanita thiersii Skay4041]
MCAVEKYVTRAEYDELKARLDELTALVHRYLPVNPTNRQIGLATSTSPHSGIAGIHSEAVQSHNPGLAVHQSMPPPPVTQTYHPDLASPQAPPQRIVKVDEQQQRVRSPIRSQHASDVSPQLPFRTRSPMTLSTRHRVAADTNTASASSSRSPVIPIPGATPKSSSSLPPSLASITSHYSVSDLQSKNCLAQMLTPGEHLRTVFPNTVKHPKDLAVFLTQLIAVMAHLVLAYFTAVIPVAVTSAKAQVPHLQQALQPLIALA